MRTCGLGRRRSTATYAGARDAIGDPGPVAPAALLGAACRFRCASAGMNPRKNRGLAVPARARTAARSSASENGFVSTSATMACRSAARSRWSAKPVISRIVRSGKSRLAAMRQRDAVHDRHADVGEQEVEGASRSVRRSRPSPPSPPCDRVAVHLEAALEQAADRALHRRRGECGPSVRPCRTGRDRLRRIRRRPRRAAGGRNARCPCRSRRRTGRDR